MPESKTKKQLMGRVIPVSPGIQMFGPPPNPGFNTWAKMRANPVIALVRLAATFPIRRMELVVEATDDAPAGAEEFIEETITPHLRVLIKEALRALDYGFAPFELVYAQEKGSIVIKRIKALSPAQTIIKQDENGLFSGLKQGVVELTRDESLLYTYDREYDDLYGRPRHENIRVIWHHWNSLLGSYANYATKVSSIIPVLRFPGEETRIIDGQEVSTEEIAQEVLNNLASAKGVGIESSPIDRSVETMQEYGVNPESFAAWSLTFVEASSSHGQDLLNAIEHYEKLMVRGWLMPERSILEGHHGTKAEAATHTDLGIAASSEIQHDLLNLINNQVLNRMLNLNYGPDAVDTLKYSVISVSPRERDFMFQTAREIYRTLASKDGLAGIQDLVDLAALAEQTGLPVGEE